MMPDMLRRRATPLDIAGLVLALVSAAPLHAQPPPSAAPPGAQGGPAPPTLPDTIARDTQGRATLRAVRATTPLRQDGRLDETIYGTVRPASDFIQMEPRGGQTASEKTEVWVFFDRDNLYVSFRAWESRPDRMIANEMRRDSGNIRQGDSVGVRPGPVVSGHKSNSCNWLPSSMSSDWEPTSKTAVEMGIFSKSVTLRICRSL